MSCGWVKSRTWMADCVVAPSNVAVTVASPPVTPTASAPCTSTDGSDDARVASAAVMSAVCPSVNVAVTLSFFLSSISIDAARGRKGDRSCDNAAAAAARRCPLRRRRPRRPSAPRAARAPLRSTCSSMSAPMGAFGEQPAIAATIDGAARATIRSVSFIRVSLLCHDNGRLGENPSREWISTRGPACVSSACGQRASRQSRSPGPSRGPRPVARARARDRFSRARGGPRLRRRVRPRARAAACARGRDQDARRPTPRRLLSDAPISVRRCDALASRRRQLAGGADTQRRRSTATERRSPSKASSAHTETRSTERPARRTAPSIWTRTIEPATARSSSSETGPLRARTRGSKRSPAAARCATTFEHAGLRDHGAKRAPPRRGGRSWLPRAREARRRAQGPQTATRNPSLGSALAVDPNGVQSRVAPRAVS